MASDTQTIPYDERLTDEDLGKLVRLAIHTARKNARRTRRAATHQHHHPGARPDVAPRG